VSIQVTDPKVKYRTATGWLDPLTGETSVIRYPTINTVGVNAIPGWTPTVTITDDNYRIIEPGAVVEDLHVINGSILVFAPHVTLRRCRIDNGAIINSDGPVVNNGLLIEDCTIESTPPSHEIPSNSCIIIAGYTVRRTACINVNEGYSTGGTAFTLADPTDPNGYAVRMYDSITVIHAPGAGPCPDYHGDGIQTVDIGGTGGTPLIIRNSVIKSIDFLPDCGGSSCMDAFYGQSQPPDIDRLLLSGAAASYRGSAGGSIRNMVIENDKWAFFPVSIEEERWAGVTHWDCVLCDGIDVDGQPGPLVARVPFGYPGFGPFDPV
jgi:hypothetical protein